MRVPPAEVSVMRLVVKRRVVAPAQDEEARRRSRPSLAPAQVCRVPGPLGEVRRAERAERTPLPPASVKAVEGGQRGGWEGHGGCRFLRLCFVALAACAGLKMEIGWVKAVGDGVSLRGSRAEMKTKHRFTLDRKTKHKCRDGKNKDENKTQAQGQR
eukprot:scaffold457_cov111-Isochrysis_galbana.AAC.4